MNTNKWVTVLVRSSAGFCDTVTFLCIDRLFVHFVTGNFIVLAFDWSYKIDKPVTLKLLTVPVYLLTTAAGCWITGLFPLQYVLLQMAGILLALAGLVTCILQHLQLPTALWQQVPGLLSIGAMALLRAFCLVTRAAQPVWTPSVRSVLLDYGFTAGCFLFGCIAGVGCVSLWGLASLLVPAVALLFFSFFILRSADTPAL